MSKTGNTADVYATVLNYVSYFSFKRWYMQRFCYKYLYALPTINCMFLLEVKLLYIIWVKKIYSVYNIVLLVYLFFSHFSFRFFPETHPIFSFTDLYMYEKDFLIMTSSIEEFLFHIITTFPVIYINTCIPWQCKR